MQDEQAPQKNGPSFLGLIAFVSRTLATSVEVFLHRGFGERYFGVHAVAVIPGIILFAGMCGKPDLRGLMAFLVLYVVWCLFGRIGIALRRRRGEVEHSYYNGRPFFLRWRIFKNVKEQSAKGAEVFLVFLAGAFMMPVSESLGSYLMVAALGLHVSLCLTASYQRTRRLAMQDALIEQRNLMERIRESNWLN